MESHEADLRAEVHDNELVTRIQEDYRSANLSEPERRLLDFATKLTLSPTEMQQPDVAGLREAGFSDETILDAVQTISYFNYANRLMDALGIEPEPGMRHRRD